LYSAEPPAVNARRPLTIAQQQQQQHVWTD